MRRVKVLSLPVPFRALCPISGSNDSRKRYEMRLISKLGTVPLLALMNVLVTFNAHLSLSDTLPN